MRPNPLIIGNWKMHGSTSQARELAEYFRGQVLKQELKAEVVLCPAFPYLTLVAHYLVGTTLKLGGQDCHTQVEGAYTGDVSAAMLSDLGCAYVICGHSERRSQHQESDVIVKAKAEAAHKAGLISVICIGENQHQRDKGRTLEVLYEQVKGSLPATATSKNTVFAYEPLWAIGTGTAARAQDVNVVFKFLQQQIKQQIPEDALIRLLYGGSVTPDNVNEFLQMNIVNGVLVGGVSLKAQDFWALVTHSFAC
ncbi:MAG: triose-phosphate isomerase [Pseudomonadota bacterium]